MSTSNNYSETDFLLKEEAEIISFNTNENISINKTKQHIVMRDSVPRPRLVDPNINNNINNNNIILHSEDDEDKIKKTIEVSDIGKRAKKDIVIDIKEKVKNDIIIDINENISDKQKLIKKTKQFCTFKNNSCFILTLGSVLTITIACIYNYL